MDNIADMINEMEWLEPVEKSLDAAAEATLNRKNPVMTQVRNFLHGTWLGHPLHPVLTDVPLGAWSVSTALDLYELSTGDETFAPGADVAVGVGLLGAAGAAVAGINDWQFTNDKPKRVGALHAVVNIAATLCYVGSWVERQRGNRRSGIVSGLTGFCLSMAGAYLGGHLVYKEKIGVNHAPQELPTKFLAVMKQEDLPEGKLKKAEVDGIPVVLVRRAGRIFALAETCAHMGGPLSEGKLEDNSVRCPWHGSRFSLETGEAIEGPTAFSQPCFDTRVRNGKIEIRRRRFA